MAILTAYMFPGEEEGETSFTGRAATYSVIRPRCLWLFEVLLGE